MTRDEKRGTRAFKRTFFGLMTVVVIALWGIAHLPDTSVNVTSNLDGQAPMTTRTLVPRETTTTAHTLTSGPQRTTTTVARHVDELTLVFDGRAITIHRTAATAPLFKILEGLQP